MAVNPLLLPIIFELHDIGSFEELSSLLLQSHLMTGHFTGFGKLVDEKILPQVFGTEKLSSAYRKTKPFNEHCFDEIDHLIKRADGKEELLSLKASRWTIQLTMAVQLNAAFKHIKEKYGDRFGGVRVGVFYGKKATLTDKYDILRGINRGAKHDVTDLTSYVSVHAGREFWSWLYGGEVKTQDWLMEGIRKGLVAQDMRKQTGVLLKAFTEKFGLGYKKYLREDKTVDWDALLTDING